MSDDEKAEDCPLELINAKFIQQLNLAVTVLDYNQQLLTTEFRDAIRDLHAIQRTFLQYLEEKGLVENEEDKRLFQKLHNRNIAQIDQELADQRKKSGDQD